MVTYAISIIDLDGFKTVNDELWHDFGDELLKQVAVRIGDCIRETDLLARLGGDEFTVILRKINEQDSAAVISKKSSIALILLLKYLKLVSIFLPAWALPIFPKMLKRLSHCSTTPIKPCMRQFLFAILLLRLCHLIFAYGRQILRLGGSRFLF